MYSDVLNLHIFKGDTFMHDELLKFTAYRHRPHTMLFRVFQNI